MIKFNPSQLLCILFLALVPAILQAQSFYGYYSNQPLTLGNGHPRQCETINGYFTYRFYANTGDIVKVQVWSPGLEISGDAGATWHGSSEAVVIPTPWPSGLNEADVLYRYTAPATIGAEYDGQIHLWNQTLGGGYNGSIHVRHTGVTQMTASNNGPVCTGGSVNLSTYSPGDASYSWTGPSGFTTTTISATITGITTAMAGAYSVTLTRSSGCTASATTVVSVNTAAPLGIYGKSVICSGASVPMASPLAGGTWSSGNTAVATVSSTGIVTGKSTGTAVITYNNACGISTKTITVNPMPAAIGGGAAVCAASTITLTNTSAGGVWSSSNTAIATVGSLTGIVTGTGTGSVIISYTLAGVCGNVSVTKAINVNGFSGAVSVVSGSSVISTIAGNGTSGFTGDGSLATSARVNNPRGIATDKLGNIYICDMNNNRVRKIAPSGIITTFAGGGSGGDGGAATAASLTTPIGIASDETGNIYVTELSASRVRKISPSGIITTIAGNGTAGSAGDEGVATAAQLNFPWGITVDKAGNVFVSEEAGNRVRKINTAGIITTYAGTGVAGYNGENIAATAAKLNGPTGMYADEDGNVYICQISDMHIRKVRPDGMISTLAGNGSSGLNGDGGPATAATVWSPMGITGDRKGNFYISDASNNVIRKINAAGIISTISGSPSGTYSGEGGQSIDAHLWATGGITTDTAGNILCALSQTARVVRIAADTTVNNGVVNICAGQSVNLYNASGGGTWSSGNTSVATIATNGLVTGVATGSALISYTGSCGAFNSIVTVNVIGSAGTITGNTQVCVGTAGTLASTIAGGTWHSGNPTVVNVGYGSGKVTGIAAGTADVTYSIPTSCGVYTSAVTVTVNATTTGAITGPGTVCNSGTATLTNATGGPGGTWVSGNTAIATVAAATGIVTGVSPGTASISFVSGGCSISEIITVINSSAGTITSNPAVCAGAHTTLTATVPDGIWSSSNPSVASVSSNIVFGISPGTATITYTLTNTCGSFTATKVMTVTPSAGTIGGTIGICEGSGATLSGSVSGGTWTSNNTDIATIGSTSGILNGIKAGTATISYTQFTGCFSTTIVSVNATPSITLEANPVICPGVVDAPLLFSDMVGAPNGYSIAWSTGALANGFQRTGDTATGNIISAVMSFDYGMEPTKVITDGSGNIYTIHNGNKVRKTDANGNVTIFAGSGSSAIGDGGPATAAALNSPYALAMDNSGNIYIAEMGSHVIRKVNTSGIITTIAGANGTSGYTGDGGPATAAKLNQPWSMAVDAANNIYVADFGNNAVRKISASGIITTVAGNGTSGAFSEGIMATATSLYHPTAVTVDAGGNLFIAQEYAVRKVKPTGIINTIAGTGDYGSSGDGGPATNAKFEFISDIVTDSYGNLYINDWFANVVRRVSASGIVRTIAGDGPFGTAGYAGDGGPGIAAGLNSPKGIALDGSGNLLIADNGNRAIRKLSYIYSSILLADFIHLGVPAMAPAGTYSATLTINNSFCSATYPVGVTISSTAASPITGDRNVCPGSSILLRHITAGGTWSSGNTAVAAVGSNTGVVTGVSAGTAPITYLAPTTCGTFSVTAVVTVNPAANTGTISGTAMVCIGATTTLSSTQVGGTWSSSNAAVATVSAAGVVNGVTAGTVVISYTCTNDCGPVSALTIVTVNASTDAGTISGAGTICAGASSMLTTSIGGGTWASSNTAVATVGSTGMVMGVANGLVTISYSVTNGCGSATTTKEMTVNSTVLLTPITGTATVCPGSSATLSNATGGGVWTSGNTTVATVGSSSGVIMGIAGGTAVISYALTTDCGIAYATQTVTVNPLADAGTVSGTATVCLAMTTTLASTAGGGVWSSANTAIATVGSASGIVTGVAAGTAVISYAVTNGCGPAVVTAIVTVNPLPDAGSITGAGAICPGATLPLANTVSGGVWASSNTAVATVGSASGIVTGVAAGNTTISYTVTNGCGTATASATVTVNPAPNAGTITGATSVTAGATTPLSSTASGGTWSVSNTNATVSGTGVVTGVALGSVIVSYTVTNSCGTAVATKVLTVASFTLGGITGNLSVCQGTTSALSNTTTGGTWNISNYSVANINTTTGLLTAVGAGTATVVYTYGVYTTSATVTVNPLPATISGPTSVCMNASITLTDATTGGTWSSSNTALGTVSMAGVVTGIAVGTPVISYALSTGCYRTLAVTVKGLPGGISGNAGLCIGATSTLTAGTGTSWSSSTPAVATVGAVSGVVTGVSAGTSTITFNASTGCIATRIVTVATAPAVAAITGPSGVLVGGTITLSDATPGGVWSSNSTARATVSAGGVVTGISAPAATISYTVTNDVCVKSVTKLITVTSHRPGGNEGFAVIRVFPNPTTGQFTVESPVSGTFTVYTMDGKLVQQMDVVAGTNAFNLRQELAAGVYVCRFNGDDGSSTMVRLVYE